MKLYKPDLDFRIHVEEMGLAALPDEENNAVSEDIPERVADQDSHPAAIGNPSDGSKKFLQRYSKEAKAARKVANSDKPALADGKVAEKVANVMTGPVAVYQSHAAKEKNNKGMAASKTVRDLVMSPITLGQQTYFAGIDEGEAPEVALAEGIVAGLASPYILRYGKEPGKKRKANKLLGSDESKILVKVMHLSEGPGSVYATHAYAIEEINGEEVNKNSKGMAFTKTVGDLIISPYTFGRAKYVFHISNGAAPEVALVKGVVRGALSPVTVPGHQYIMKPGYKYLVEPLHLKKNVVVPVTEFTKSILGMNSQSIQEGNAI